MRDGLQPYARSVALTGIESTGERPTSPTAAIGSTVLVTLGGALGVFLTGAVSVQIGADIAFGPAQLGAGTFVFFVVSALASPFAGHLTQRRGNRFVMRSAAAAALLAAAVIASALSGPQIFLGLALAGVASALAAPSCNALLAVAVEARRRALAFGIKQSAVPFSTMLGGLAVPLIALTVGWRAAYLIPALVALIALLTVPQAAGAAPAVGTANQSPIAPGTMAVLALGTALGSGAGSSVGAFIVPALVDGGVAEGAAGRAAAIGGGIAVLGRVAIGAIQDRLSIDPLRVVAGILVVGTVALTILATGPTRGLEILVPVAFLGSWGWPGLYSYAVVTAYPDAPAKASGYAQFGAYSGAALGPFAFGFVAEHGSYQAAFAMIAAIAAAGAITMTVSAAFVRRLASSRQHDEGLTSK